MNWGLLGLPAFLIWFTILLLPWRPWSTRETLEAAPDLTVDLSHITVLMPARNEQSVIADSLRALKNQGANLNIVLINDQSNDNTVNIARSSGIKNLKIIDGEPVPEGWSGKLWALEQGLTLVESEYILLLDADIHLDKGTIASLLRKLEKENLDMISLMAFLRMQNYWEKLLMPAFIYFFKMLYSFQLSNSSSRFVAAAAGGCILIKRSILEKIDGFNSLKNCLIDDCALARKVKNNEGKIWIGLTHSARSLRRYENLLAIWKMVARTAFTQLNYSITLLLLCTLLMIFAFLIPVGTLFIPIVWVMLLSVITIIMMCASYIPVLKYYSIGYMWVFYLPLISILYLGMTWTSAFTHLFSDGANWKDRLYSAHK